MKIALCLHGLFNSLTDSTSNGIDGYEHIKKNILMKGNVDVFIHSWDVNNVDEIIDLYSPKKYIIEKQKDFNDIIISRGLNQLKNTPRPLQSVLSHLYSVTEAFKLLYGTNENYDVVIKGRFDLGRINRNTSGPNRYNQFPVQCINFDSNIETNKIYMANWDHFKMGPPDMWFYGSKIIMEEFTMLFSLLEKQLYLNSEFHKFAIEIENNEGDLSNAIAFYKYWMIKNGLWEKRHLLETIWE